MVLNDGLEKIKQQWWQNTVMTKQFVFNLKVPNTNTLEFMNRKFFLLPTIWQKIKYYRNKTTKNGGGKNSNYHEEKFSSNGNIRFLCTLGFFLFSALSYRILSLRNMELFLVLTPCHFGRHETFRRNLLLPPLHPTH
jgi:hypothetical protein